MQELESKRVIAATRHWLDSVILAMNLCPFAKPRVVQNSIHYSYTDAASEERLLEDLADELVRLDASPEISTTLLIHPAVLVNYSHYNQFLELAEQLLEMSGYTGVYQVVGFHPQFQFADTDQSDVGNYTNRSPYPMLHILREAEVTDAVEQHPNVEAIPQQNIKTLEQLGLEKLKKLLLECTEFETN